MKKKRELLDLVKIYVTATFNNTLVTATNIAGETFAWETAGSAGFKGTRKSTPFAATTTAQKLISKVLGKGVRQVEVYIKGPGPGRDAVLRAIRAAGLKINLIADVTPVPHNGVRPKKRRRV